MHNKDFEKCAFWYDTKAKRLVENICALTWVKNLTKTSKNMEHFFGTPGRATTLAFSSALYTNVACNKYLPGMVLRLSRKLDKADSLIDVYGYGLNIF